MRKFDDAEEQATIIFQFLSGFQDCRGLEPTESYTIGTFNSFPDSRRGNNKILSVTFAFSFQFLSGFQLARRRALSRQGYLLSIPFRIPDYDDEDGPGVDFSFQFLSGFQCQYRQQRKCVYSSLSIPFRIPDMSMAWHTISVALVFQFLSGFQCDCRHGRLTDFVKIFQFLSGFQLYATKYGLFIRRWSFNSFPDSSWPRSTC